MYKIKYRKIPKETYSMQSRKNIGNSVAWRTDIN